jgi:hypothetical protein
VFVWRVATRKQSDPVAKVGTLDERAAEIEAVMDAAGFGTAALRAGVTHVSADFVADSRDHYEEQAAALVSLERCRRQPPSP